MEGSILGQNALPEEMKTIKVKAHQDPKAPGSSKCLSEWDAVLQRPPSGSLKTQVLIPAFPMTGGRRLLLTIPSL
jgi:hypothetical protein